MRQAIILLSWRGLCLCATVDTSRYPRAILRQMAMAKVVELGRASCGHTVRFSHCYITSRPSPAGMVGNTAIANGNTTHWAKDCMGVTSSTAAALSARDAGCAAFNRVLAGSIHFRHGEIASKLGWHGGELYTARVARAQTSILFSSYLRHSAVGGGK